MGCPRASTGGPAWRSPAGWIPHELQGICRWSECLPTLGTLRPKPPAFDVPRLPAVLPYRWSPDLNPHPLHLSGAGCFDCHTATKKGPVAVWGRPITTCGFMASVSKPADTATLPHGPGRVQPVASGGKRPLRLLATETIPCDTSQDRPPDQRLAATPFAALRACHTSLTKRSVDPAKEAPWLSTLRWVPERYRAK
jgi:hypothetical protein